MERVEIHRLIYDPKDLAEVVEGTQHPGARSPQDALVPLSPHNLFALGAGGNYGKVSGMAFDPQTRTLFVTVPRQYKIGVLTFPTVHGWRMKETYYTGDINKDLHVDVVDLLTFVASWGLSAGEPGFDPLCDLNADDSVDVVDLLLLVENLGR